MKEKENIVYIAVFSNQERNFDEFGHGYLPLFHPVFKISHDKNKVLDEVYRHFYADDSYEVTEEVCSIHDDGDNGYTFTIKYNDRTSDAHAVYTLDILKEFIE